MCNVKLVQFSSLTLITNPVKKEDKKLTYIVLSFSFLDHPSTGVAYIYSMMHKIALHLKIITFKCFVFFCIVLQNTYASFVLCTALEDMVYYDCRESVIVVPQLVKMADHTWNLRWRLWHKLSSTSHGYMFVL